MTDFTDYKNSDTLYESVVSSKKLNYLTILICNKQGTSNHYFLLSKISIPSLLRFLLTNLTIIRLTLFDK